jgi:hypothetical protein
MSNSRGSLLIMLGLGLVVPGVLSLGGCHPAKLPERQNNNSRDMRLEPDPEDLRMPDVDLRSPVDLFGADLSGPADLSNPHDLTLVQDLSMGGDLAMPMDFAMPPDMTMPPGQVMDDFDDILTEVMGHPGPWSDAELRDISTVTFARPDVSLLTIHGDADDNVYVEQGERITEVLRERGAEVEFLRLDGGEGRCHADCWKVPRARDALLRFLSRKLVRDGDRRDLSGRGQGS